MRRTITISLVAVLPLLACDREATSPDPVIDGPHMSAVTSTSNFNVPVNFTWDYTEICPDRPDIIDFTGTIHQQFHTTIDANGGFHTKAHYQPQDMKGVGRLTGDIYIATGVTQWQQTGTVGETYTFVNKLSLVAQGSGIYSLLLNIVHYTVNTNGDVTAYFDKWKADCK